MACNGPEGITEVLDMGLQLSWVCMAALIMLCVAAVPPAAADGKRKADFYVSTKGNDAWSGRRATPNKAGTDGPFATLTRARDALRTERREADRPYTVRIRGGVYRLDEPVVFAPEDSGTEQGPVAYVAYGRERPIFSGGRAIAGWKRGEGEIWTVELPEVRAGEWYFQQLFVNGERRTRARTPNEGYLRTAGPLPEIGNPRADRRNREAKMGFTYREGDLSRWDGLEDVNLFVYHSWTASLHWIESLDAGARTVRFTAPAHWPIGWWEREQRYYVENYLEALDSPGEWYLDRRTGVLHYWPLPGEDLAKAEVVAPVLRELVRFEGDPEAGEFVEHITLSGLSFQHCDWYVADKGEADGQAAVFLNAAVFARGARHCAIERCEIAHVGQYGLWLERGCQDNRVFHCHIHDLGGGGVRIGETRSPENEEVASLRNVVDNNFIHDGGHVFPAGVGVWIGRSSHHTVSHNEICDFYYTGVSVGWSWGYAPSSANHNIIEYNHIHHLGKGVLSDMGGIYTLGVSPGTVLRHQVIHDVYSYSYGGWGLYTDEGSTDILLENNVVYNTKTGGFHQHYGRENIVRNNIFAFSREGQLIRTREEEHISFTLERNIVLCDNGRVLGSNWKNGNYRLDHNLYWDTSEEGINFSGASFEEWQAQGNDEHSIVEDPLFVNAEEYDFRLKPNSPAAKIGFEPIDTSEVGLYGEREWVNAPKKIVRPALDVPAPG
ncbi:MAG: right-handed parallel beta-helix repeat-containing protein [Armatimonadota bacterium]